MTFDAYQKKYLGKKIDWDGVYGGQCVDNFRQYVQEVLGFPQPKGIVGAKDFWTNYDTDPNLKNFYDKVPNTPTGVPIKGDIPIWNEKVGGGFGHIDIFIEGNMKSFSGFDQNWPTLSVCTVTAHTYTNLLGWLHPKTAQPAPNPDALQVCLDDHRQLVDQIEKDLKPAIGDLKTKNEGLQGRIDSFNDWQKSLADLLGCENQTTVIAGAISELIKTEQDLVIAQKENTKLQDTITDNYVEEVKTTVFPPAEPPKEVKAIPTPIMPRKSFLDILKGLRIWRK
jgi:hypothetical protein